VAKPDAVKFNRAIVVGAGLAGLSAAVALRRKGVDVCVFEAAAQAGGRCRSYHDPQLGMTIDNGNHLVLSGNQAVARFRKAIGVKTPLAGPREAAFAFRDLRDGQSWTIRINDGRLPWWVLFADRRVPGTRLRDYIYVSKLKDLVANSVEDNIRLEGPLWEKLLEPVLLAVLNTPPARGAGRLVGNVVRQTLGRGGKAMQPRIAEPTLAAAFIEPALAWLEAKRQRSAIQPAPGNDRLSRGGMRYARLGAGAGTDRCRYGGDPRCPAVGGNQSGPWPEGAR